MAAIPDCPSIKADIPTESQLKYDRQLRLWASSGQRALEEAHVVFFNSGAGVVAIEALKNIVLPGVGRFTLIDEGLVSEGDLGVNFFLRRSALGQSRARSCVEYLTELNPDVCGDWWPKTQGPLDIELVLQQLPIISLILYTLPLTKAQQYAIESYGYRKAIPVISIYSLGFYSYFHVDYPQPFPIIEAHSDPTTVIDLRLLNPWPELADFVHDLTTGIESMDDYRHGHLPFVAIILHYLEQWKRDHDGNMPVSVRDRSLFRKMLQNANRKNVPGGSEENFDEAIAILPRVLSRQATPVGIQEIFNLIDKQSVSAHYLSQFWATCQAIRVFYEIHNELPLSGDVPDMKAASDGYINLQNIYKKKARDDALEVAGYISTREGLSLPDSVEIARICRNVISIKLIHPSRMDRPETGDHLVNIIEREEMCPDNYISVSLLPIYLALKVTSHALSPMCYQDIINGIYISFPNLAPHKNIALAAKEVARAKGGELHNISAITGGLVAQESIKILTNQYVPIDNTCIFDGINSRCQVLRL